MEPEVQLPCYPIMGVKQHKTKKRTGPWFFSPWIDPVCSSTIYSLFFLTDHLWYSITVAGQQNPKYFFLGGGGETFQTCWQNTQTKKAQASPPFNLTHLSWSCFPFVMGKKDQTYTPPVVLSGQDRTKIQLKAKDISATRSGNSQKDNTEHLDLCHVSGFVPPVWICHENHLHGTSPHQ